MNNALKVLVATTLLSFGQFASAAHITIDDTDIDTVTVSWADFEGGFSVGGSASSSSGSATFLDFVATPLLFSGTWLDVNAASSATNLDLGANVGSPTDITSALFFGIDADSSTTTATIDGDFNAYIGAVYVSGPASSYFQGDVLSFSASYLTFTYKSEAGETSTVPAPPMLALFGLALLGLGVRRQRQH